MKKILYLFPLCAIALLSCSKSSGNGSNGGTTTPTTVPAMSTTDVANTRTDTGVTNFRFFVTLNTSYTSPVSVAYNTVAGTAKANTDFVPASGTITIATGSTTGYVDILVKGDSLRQNDLTFNLQLSNPTNATLTGAGTAVGTIHCLGTYIPIDTTGYSTPTSYPGYTLAWGDEFNGKTLNANSWNYELGGGGWGNQELENYTNSSNNSYLTGGFLVIEARKEVLGTSNYTSARLTTQNKKQFTYGRIDMRAKVPVSSGMWPALWMLGANIGTNPWPACGESDIMELVGSGPSTNVGSSHWALANGTVGTINNTYTLTGGADFSQKFHVFTLIWKQNIEQMYVDDQLYMTARSTDLPSGNWPFNNPQFFIFNVAVGGNWPGPPNSTTIFPQRMLVDYVRVFQ